MAMATVSNTRLLSETIPQLTFPTVGRKNRHCLCESCEKKGRGGYAPEQDDENIEPSDSTSNSDSESESDSSAPEAEPHGPPPNVNERRTRRGVYAIVTREEESDESENEDDNKVPLADAKDIPADGEIELTTEIDTASELTSLTPSIPPHSSTSRDPLTPAPDLLSRFSSSLSSLSSAGDASSPRSDSSTPFRSIISTRRQKAQEVLSNQQDKEPATPSKRLTRSASALLSIDKDKGKAKAAKSAAPSETPKRGRPSTAGNDAVQVKKEEVEPRVLRARPSVPAVPETRKPPPKPDAPRGADGKLLPTCATCSSILPLISVDSKVVWGLGFENGKKKKKHDCPRSVVCFVPFFFFFFFFFFGKSLMFPTPTGVCVILQSIISHGLAVCLLMVLLSQSLPGKSPLLPTRTSV
jgi:histone-lysine N-methyltransferase SUV420H